MESETGNDASNLWKSQQVEPAQISLAELRQRAQRLERRVRRRNLREYSASAIVIAGFGYYISKFPDPMIRFGCVLVIAGTLFVVHMLHKRGHARAVPEEIAFRNCLDFHRTELKRQRDLLRNVWTWYLLPFVLGGAVFLLGIFEWKMKLPNVTTKVVIIAFSLEAALVALVFILIGKLNQLAARKLQREIDVLDSLEREC